jgi:hypothetical protein
VSVSSAAGSPTGVNCPDMTDEQIPDIRPPGPGRRPSPVEGDEPGASYVAALRRWPEDVARIPRTALAKQINCDRGLLV